MFTRRNLCAASSVFLLALVLILPLAAQEARWKELNAQVAQLFKQGKYTDAMSPAQESLRVAEATFGAQDPNVATSLNNLSTLYEQQGRYAEAEPLLKRALAIREEAFGPDNPHVASSLNNLAELYRLQGRSADVEPLTKRALAIREKALGPDNLQIALSLNNLAEAYSEQGRYAEAEPLYKRALAIREKTFGPGVPDVALLLDNLAALYALQGRYADAEPLFKRALAIDERSLGPDHPDVATDLNNLAEAYSGQGRYAEAEPLLKRALAISEKALGPDHSAVAAATANLALLYKEQGRYAEAEQLQRRALAIYEKALGPGHPSVAHGLFSLAITLYAGTQSAQAGPLFDRAFETLARQFEYYFTYMSEKDRLAFLATVQYQFPVYFSFCFTYYQQRPELVGKLYDTVLWQKGFIAQSVAGVRAQIAASGDQETLALLGQFTAKKTQLAGLLTSVPKDREAWKKQIAQLELETNDLEKELVKRSGTLAEQKKLARVSWRDVQKTLKPSEAALEFVRFDYHDGKKWTGGTYYVALIVTPESTTPTLLVLGDAKDLEADPLRDYRLRVGLKEERAARGVVVQVEEQPGAPPPKTSFFDAFWKPLEPALAGVKRVYVSPDGVLNQVSLGVAADAAGKPLMEKYDLRIVSSTKDLLREKRTSSANSAVLVGNPTFALDETQQRAALRSVQQPQSSQPALVATATGSRSRDLAGGALPPLPGTQAEVEAVSALLGKQRWNVQAYTQQNALKERVLQVRAPRILHLATHGFFEPNQPQKQRELGSDKPSGLEDPMLRSGLYFAGANRRLTGQAPPPDLDDGVLTAYEASTLNLQGTELVVLSACETGLGQASTGEGVFGLRRGLQVAGAESVLMSMWAVPDRETQELMSLFYEKWLAGTEKHEALRAAQLEMRARVLARYGKNLPVYWGAFVLVGR